MDKRHTENIQNFIGRKIQRAENYLDNNCPELALDLLADVEKDINKGVQTGLLAEPESYRQEAEALVRIRDKAVSLIKIDERRV